MTQEEQQRVEWQTTSGETVTIGEVAATPQSQALAVRWPRGGWVWNRPVAVLVGRGEEEERIPIVDVTRVAQLGLYGLSLVFGILGLLMWVAGRNKDDERDI
jgi:hypothetical protein